MSDAIMQWEDLFNLLPDAILVVDESGRVVFANTAVSELLGHTAGELVGGSLDCVIPERYRAAHGRQFANFHAHGRPMSMSERPLLAALHKSGREIPISISISNLDLAGRRYSIAVMRDGGLLQMEITEAKNLAETDALTGIGSRLRLSRLMQSALAEARPFSLLFLDLRKFKPFNDDYGHAIGDQVLQIVARRLQVQIRTRDLAARLGGDEFVLVFDGVASADLLQRRAASISKSLSQPFHIGGLCLTVGFNIGGAIYPLDGDSERELLEVADRNMYQAKRAGLEFHIE